MHSLGSLLVPFDQEIERTTHALRKETREADMDEGILEEERLSSFSDSEEEVMAVAQPLTMGGYYKWTDEGKVSRRFVPEDAAYFDINNVVFSGLR